MTKVNISAITQPRVSGVNTAEEFVAYAARVSNPGNQMNTLTATKLVKYLYDHKHWSPFEMVSVTMEIETTRAIAHQIVRHRSFSFQEFSQRYADPKALGDVYVPSEARLQDHKNRQNSVETEDNELHAIWREKQDEVFRTAMDAYTWAVTNGIAKEVARNPLPEGMTKSRLYMAGTLRSWIHYVQARGPGSGTQKEHMEIAAQALPLLLEEFPSLTELLGQ